MILVIRIAGLVSIPRNVQETLYRIRLHKKYTATLLEDTEENRKLLEGLRNFVAYGDISEETKEKLIEKRGQVSGKKGEIKPFFRLHPAGGGIDSKMHYGVRKGVLGNNKEGINKLVERML